MLIGDYWKEKERRGNINVEIGSKKKLEVEVGGIKKKEEIRKV